MQPLLIHLAPLACPTNTPDDLLPAERLGHTAALDNGQDRGFHGGEPSPTLGARPAAPNGLAFISFPGINHPRVGMPAERTVHDRSFAAPTFSYRNPP